MTERPSHVLVLRPEPGVDAIRALRFGLKMLKRRCGLMAVRVYRAAENCHPNCHRTA
jgi:hypothetical protein